MEYIGRKDSRNGSERFSGYLGTIFGRRDVSRGDYDWVNVGPGLKNAIQHHCPPQRRSLDPTVCQPSPPQIASHPLVLPMLVLPQTISPPTCVSPATPTVVYPGLPIQGNKRGLMRVRGDCGFGPGARTLSISGTRHGANHRPLTSPFALRRRHHTRHTSLARAWRGPGKGIVAIRDALCWCLWPLLRSDSAQTIGQTSSLRLFTWRTCVGAHGPLRPSLKAMTSVRVAQRPRPRHVCSWRRSPHPLSHSILPSC